MVDFLKILWRRRLMHADKLTASSAPGQLIGGGCFAIALTGSAHAPPIKAIEPSAILSFSVSKLPPKPASLAAHPPPLYHDEME